MMKKRRPVDVHRAFEYFQEAIRLEPGYVEPYHGAAMYYIVSAAFGAMPPQTALLEAGDLVAKGLVLDANSVISTPPGNGAHVPMALDRVRAGASASHQSGTDECISPHDVSILHESPAAVIRKPFPTLPRP